MEKGRLWKLFSSTFMLSAFTFGGGYVIVTLMKERFVDRYHWIEEEEMLDMTAIAQSAPGPIAVNGAIVVGYKLAKIPGVLVSVAGTILPPFLILSLISLFYDAFADNIWVSTVLDQDRRCRAVGRKQGCMQAGVAALIAAVVWDMSAGVVREHNALDITVLIAAFALNQFFGVNVVIIIFACIVIGVIRSIAGRKKVSA